jgi:hypothetical protein
MSSSPSHALTCGFADPGRAVAAACWRRGEESGGLVMAEGAVSPAQVEFEDKPAAVRLRAYADDASVTAELRVHTLVLPAGPGAYPDPRIGEAEVEFEQRCATRSIVCPAQVTRWSSDPLEGNDLVRHLALPLADDGELICVARRQTGATEHGDEEMGAWRLSAEEETVGEFEEVLLSTQYDRKGRPTRVGLELWPRGDELGAMRPAGVAIGAVETERCSLALLDTSSEGYKGIGSYLIWRR